MEISTIIAAISGLKSAKEIITALKDLHIENDTLVKINEAVKQVNDAYEKLFELRDELSNLKNENDNLKKHLGEIESFKNKMADYDLIKTNGGAIVYKYQKAPLYYLCPKCIDNKEIQFLQDDTSEYSGWSECPNCNRRYSIEKDKELPSNNYGMDLL